MSEHPAITMLRELLRESQDNEFTIPLETWQRVRAVITHCEADVQETGNRRQRRPVTRL